MMIQERLCVSLRRQMRWLDAESRPVDVSFVHLSYSLQALESLGLIYRIPESAIPQLPTEPGGKEED